VQISESLSISTALISVVYTWFVYFSVGLQNENTPVHGAAEEYKDLPTPYTYGEVYRLCVWA
jgi:hypothetical protein